MSLKSRVAAVLVTAAAVAAPVVLATPAHAGGTLTRTTSQPYVLYGEVIGSGKITSTSSTERLMISCQVQRYIVRSYASDYWGTVGGDSVFTTAAGTVSDREKAPYVSNSKYRTRCESGPEFVSKTVTYSAVFTTS